MNLFFQHKSYLFLLGGIGIVVVFILILAFMLLRSTSSQKTNSSIISPTPIIGTPQPTEYDPYSEAYKESNKKILQEEKNSLDQDQNVARFLQKLPFQGTYFTAKYDISTNTTTVTIAPSPTDEGEKEFDAFLAENGIQNRNLLPNLTVRYRETNSPID